MKYFIYTRKSTEEDDRQVLSIEAQLVELKEFAANRLSENSFFIKISKIFSLKLVPYFGEKWSKTELSDSLARSKLPKNLIRQLADKSAQTIFWKGKRNFFMNFLTRSN